MSEDLLMNNNPNQAVEALVKQTNSLITLPEVCLKLREVQGDPTHTISDVAKVIMHDPALTARVLRIVNSAYYGLFSPVKDITHALGLLGSHDLNNLVLVTSIVNTMNSLETELDIKSFWQTSVFCAVMSKTLGKHYNNKNAEELFISGLLLNVGKLLLYYNEPDLFKTVEEEIRRSESADYEVENKILGFDHADVGAAMAKSWNFSEVLMENISRHHNPPVDNSEIGSYHITYMAGLCSEILDITMSCEIDFNEIDLSQYAYKDYLKLSEEEFSELLKASYEGYLQAYEAFCGGVH